ncbi:hypothetical protein BV898_12573 [Hypsibius exemplaris]|uniref:Uncharacterized protein n=1 Tax=Hypsibius exemplaris TaxID=2072580 RepID=A0A1W0WDP5_HYPEX|nr:hypothetical protein BV898_12573 [Hypsibius exemplaris]
MVLVAYGSEYLKVTSHLPSCANNGNAAHLIMDRTVVRPFKYFNFRTMDRAAHESYCPHGAFFRQRSTKTRGGGLPKPQEAMRSAFSCGRGKREARLQAQRLPNPELAEFNHDQDLHQTCADAVAANPSVSDAEFQFLRPVGIRFFNEKIDQWVKSGDSGVAGVFFVNIWELGGFVKADH